MVFAWRELPLKNRIARILNVLGLIVIVTLLVIHKDRFKAMMNPAGKEIVGQTAPEFDDGVWINSEPLSLQQLSGRIVVVDFWTFKCRNCVNVLPTLNVWHEKYKDRGVVVVGVHSPETKEEANTELLRQFVVKAHIKFPIVTDNSFVIWNRYRAQFWPSTYIIDQQGVIRRFHYGELGYSSLEDDIVKLLSDVH